MKVQFEVRALCMNVSPPIVKNLTLSKEPLTLHDCIEIIPRIGETIIFSKVLVTKVRDILREMSNDATLSTNKIIVDLDDVFTDCPEDIDKMIEEGWIE